MGCAVELEVLGTPHHVDHARRRLAELEARWSRFVGDSDISRLNAAGGQPVRVDPATITLLEAMMRGTVATDGNFDPTMLEPLVGLGYAASWHGDAAVPLPGGLSGRGVIAGAAVDKRLCTAQLPVGTAIDAGGIGKGMAADMICVELLADGARGVMLSVGGDVRVAGEGPVEGDWLIGVADHTSSDVEVSQVRLAHGALATSGTLRRAWIGADGEPVHHVLDPRSQHPTVGTLQATVIAGSAAWAEVFTKVLMVRGSEGLAAVHAAGLAGRRVAADGATTCSGTWSAFETEQSCTLS